ncbi:MAG: PilZ domain-containing protein [Phycisphaerales bacterium]|nr:PilZ domain-containing protein [Phycisphaerales bacterium]
MRLVGAGPTRARLLNPFGLRRHPRHDVRGLTCSLGKVIDFSSRGMRLRRFRAVQPGRALGMTLGSTEVGRVRVRATCVWCRREGRFGYTLGLALAPASEEDGRLLSRLVELHAVTPILARAA